MIEEQLSDLALIVIGSVLTEWILWSKKWDRPLL
ncbi:MAG: hypothetical protein HLUCCX14_17770 [Marinobacter excellens HL-55]|uniref:Uncharacterized protein n=1 Tax=Marinobacter excellens HL-55 TaxID=1305731 RepID=A0A0P7YXV7_9GAMM|nr:MAG: hypothetical protein HLUCCX14_17770 [Marinobacter excellens HL-55]